MCSRLPRGAWVPGVASFVLVKSLEKQIRKNLKGLGYGS